MQDLHILPKVRDSWSYLYVEHCRIDKEDDAIALHDASGKVQVPCATLMTLMIGPGTNITHDAIRVLAECGCLVAWCGEEGIRFYAQGMGDTRSSRNLLHQARMWGSPSKRMEVVVRMYALRFSEQLEEGLTLQQIRGKEGLRVRAAYARASRRTGVPWINRSYRAHDWDATDPVNRALSAANACLYGVCHAAIVSAGYSPALGFIHTGKMLSFVYDIGDLYKTAITVPAAFEVVAEDIKGVEQRVRRRCRERFKETRLLARIVEDIGRVLDVPETDSAEEGEAIDPDVEAVIPGGLWDPQAGSVAGGRNYASVPGAQPAPW